VNVKMCEFIHKNNQSTGFVGFLKYKKD